MSMTQPGHMQAAPSLMMTTSGLKSLDETQEEQQINVDLRWDICWVVCISKAAPNITCCGLCECVASVQAVKQKVSAVFSCPQLQYCCTQAVLCFAAKRCQMSCAFAHVHITMCCQAQLIDCKVFCYRTSVSYM